jgi:hypothetical protein
MRRHADQQGGGSRAGAEARPRAHDGVSLIEVIVDAAVPVLYGQKHWRE